MSLWTPGGEHPVERRPTGPNEPATPSAAAEATPTGAAGDGPGDPFEGLSAEERVEAERMMAEMGEVRKQLSEAPAAVVVANHAMGLYELAAIHLTNQPPRLADAKLAIDAFAALVELLSGQVGQDEATLTDALHNLRLGYVQLAGANPGPT